MNAAPCPGGWLITCDVCSRVVKVRTVEGVHLYRATHKCTAVDIAQTVTETARGILARLTPDPIDVVIARRDDLTRRTA